MGTKQGPDKVTTQNTQLPQWIIDAQQQLLGSANNVTQPFLQQSPNYGVMGLTPNQTFANDLAFQSAKQVFTNPQMSAYDVFGMGNQWQSATPQAQQATAQQAKAAQAQAAQLKPTDIAPFMNPYIDTALNPTLDRLRQQQAEVQGDIGAKAAAAHMFGGSREAVQRMLADRNYRDTLGQTTGNMLMQGYNQASGLAKGNVDNQQQTNITNAALENAVNTLNAQLGTNVSMNNAQQANQMGMQTQNLAFQGSQNDASNYLKGVQLQSQQNAQSYQNQQAAINLLNSLGQQQQQTGQNAINYPQQVLASLVNAIKGLNGGETVTKNEPTFTNPLGTAAGAGLALSSLLNGGMGSFLTGGFGKVAADVPAEAALAAAAETAMFSDRDAKTDIKKLGEDPETGVDMYAYRYKGDPKSYPKVVGPMAQDLEKVLPGITKLIGGQRIVSAYA